MKSYSSLETLLKDVSMYVQYNNKQNPQIKVLSQKDKQLKNIDKRNVEYVQTEEQIEQSKYGSCYDQSFLVKVYLEQLNIPCEIFYLYTTNLQLMQEQYIYTRDITTHALIAYQIENKWKWLQWSWLRYTNNDICQQDLMVFLSKIKELTETSWHKSIHITDITSMTPGRSRLSFYNDAVKLPTIL